MPAFLVCDQAYINLIRKGYREYSLDLDTDIRV